MNTRTRRWGPLLALAALVAAASGCAGFSGSIRTRSNAVDYLYASGTKDAEPAKQVTLRVPLRVGVAFAPETCCGGVGLSELEKEKLLDGVAAAFRDVDVVDRIDVVPSIYLTPGGGFEELDRFSTLFGIDVMALVSFDQQQFSGSTKASWLYLTVVGAFVVPAEKNTTQTFVDTAAYDIPSRALLFRAGGRSRSTGRSSAADTYRQLGLESQAGFDAATTDMIENLRTALAQFREQARSGTVRGAGTPALRVVDVDGNPVGGGGGAGASGPLEVVLLALFAVLVRRKNGV